MLIKVIWNGRCSVKSDTKVNSECGDPKSVVVNYYTGETWVLVGEGLSAIYVRVTGKDIK